MRVPPIDRSGVELEELVADLSSETRMGEPDRVERLGSARLLPLAFEVVRD